MASKTNHDTRTQVSPGELSRRAEQSARDTANAGAPNGPRAESAKYADRGYTAPKPRVKRDRYAHRRWR